VLCNLLERGVLGLDVEEVDDGQLDSEPAAVDDVVLPLDGVEGDGVDVLVEEEGNVDHEEDDGHALGADVVGQDLDRVADQQAGPGQVVEDVVDEDHGDDTLACARVALDLRGPGQRSPDDKGQEHAGGGDEEEGAASDAVDEETLADGDDHVDDLEDTVDDELGLGVGDADLLEDNVDVVRDETVAGPLGEKTDGEQDDQTVTVALGLDQFHPAVTLEFGLELESVLDLLHLEQDNFILHVTVGVNVGKNLVSALLLTLPDVPTWRLWDEPDETELEQGWSSLDDGRNSPSPVVLNVVGAESQPGGNDGTKVPGGVVDGGEGSTVLGVDELGDEERRRTVSNGNTETQEETGCNEHLEVDRDGLEYDTEKPVVLLGL